MHTTWGGTDFGASSFILLVVTSPRCIRQDTILRLRRQRDGRRLGSGLWTAGFCYTIVNVYKSEVVYDVYMPFPAEKLRVLQAVDRSFDLGTRENFILNNWLLVINVMLVGVFFLDVAEHFGYVHGPAAPHTFIRNAEIVFGMLFLMEFTLRSVFVYIPDKKFFSTYSIINALVIVSLLAPHFIGNLVVLRFLQIFKVYKVYQLKKDTKSYHAKTE